MSSRNRALRHIAAAAALGLVAAACVGGGPSIAIDGSSTVFPITQAVAEKFRQDKVPIPPAEEGDDETDSGSVEVAVGVSGTGGGFEKFCRGETDISDASRPIKDEEKEACASGGVEYVELQVAIDGLSVLVNPQNSFATCLTVEELKKIWEPGSTVGNWSQVREGFPDQSLTLYGPGTDSGTFDYFTDEISGEEGASRDDYTASEDDNVLVQGIAGDPNALGYFGFAYFEQNQDKLKTVAVDGGDGCVSPGPETINSGEYKPLSRPIFIYVAKSAAGRPEVVAFVDYYLANMNSLVGDVGYIPVPDAVLTEETAEWGAFKT